MLNASLLLSQLFCTLEVYFLVYKVKIVDFFITTPDSFNVFTLSIWLLNCSYAGALLEVDLVEQP